MGKYTSYFTEEAIRKVHDEQFEKSTAKIYKVDDCHITQELKQVDTGKTIKELKESFRGKLPEYIKNRAEAITDDVPIMSYEMYLKELKDALIFNGEIQRGNLNRLWVEGSQGVMVGNVLILNKYPGKYTVISELHKAGKLNEVYEADLEELIKQMEQ